MRGRKPKPAALAVLHGDPRNIGRKRVRQRLGPPIAPQHRHLDPPASLTERQVELWNEAVQQAPPGILQAIDGSVLRTWVVACDICEQAEAQQAQIGVLVRKMNRLGQMEPAPSPLLVIMRHWSLVKMKAASELGFTPVSRPRIFGAHSPTAPVLPPTLDAGPEVPLASFLASKPLKIK